ncbi:putative quinol monooxygenase [Oceanibacterium hippocampi]|uniref:Autoinducer 2-degrading protein LsrG n=1 Tax=Oceanibacterium hippocampi TaxID=745714 RepID=A0A1Y5TLQ3_9PROT|nr:putative quinol monooxygenase [Oceanibacterium hippocampi]SLN65056.1 Autoinducer 2-degrading protein LsrG [Oceanibacterium hippocampi]
MYVVTVLFVVAPEHRKRFRAAMARQAETSLGQEPGCLQFDVCHDPAEPESCFLYEVYADEAAFRRHLESTHYKAFAETVDGWVARKSVKTYERAWPKP